MTARPPDPSATAPRRRLDSWKEIASYLERSVRTVQLWEKEEHLPVHRLQGTVLAYADELDAWVLERKVSPGPPAPAGTPASLEPSARVGVRAWLVAAVMILAAASLVIWLKAGNVEHSRTAMSFGERDSLLIASVDNRTGEPVFDGSIEYLLERELGSSGFVNVVSSERIADALTLMKRGSQKVDRLLAREVAIRDGHVRAIVAPRIERLGTRYVVGADLITVEHGRRAAAFSRKAGSHNEVYAAVEELGTELRRALGELPAGTGTPATLERVSTPSLRAAQLFTEADRVIAFRDDETAERLLREAIAEDPEFASAHMHLAFSIHNQGRRPEEYLPFVEQAVALSKSTTNQERHFILGGSASLRGNHDEALTHYKNLLEINPDHYWANNNVASILSHIQRRSRDALPYRLKLVSLRPNQFMTNYVAATGLEYWSDRQQEAEAYYRRSGELLTRDIWNQHPTAATLVRLRKADTAWQKGDLTTLLAEIDTATDQQARHSGPGADVLAAGIAEFELAVGRFDRVLALSRRVTDPALGTALLARTAYWRGDLAEARMEFEKLIALRAQVPEAGKRIPPTYAEPGRVAAGDLFLMSRCGLARTVEKHITEGPYPDRKVLLGAVRYADGAEKEAMELMREMLSIQFQTTGKPLAQMYLHTGDLISEILERRGEHDQAIALIESTSAHRLRASLAKPEWIHLQRRLAHLYRSSGRIAQAESVDARLASLTIGTATPHLMRNER